MTSADAPMHRPIRALLLGAAVAPVCYWLAMTVDAAARGVRVDLLRALRELMIISAFGAPIALAAAFFVGAPLLYGLHRLGALRASSVVLAGALVGGVVGLLIAQFQGGEMLRVRMPLPLAIVLGALSGAACWRAGTERGGPRL
jgi:hypothetical protein